MQHYLHGTDRVLLVPRSLAVLLARTGAVRVLELPIELPRFTVGLAWHEIRRRDPAHAWLRGLVASAAKRMT